MWKTEFDKQFSPTYDYFYKDSKELVKAFIETQLEKLISDIPDSIYLEGVTVELEEIKQQLRARWLK